MSKQQKNLCSWTRLMPSGQSPEEPAALINLSQHTNSSGLFDQQTESSLNCWIMNQSDCLGVSCGPSSDKRAGTQEPEQSTVLTGPLFSHPECLFWHKCQHESSVCPIGSRQLYKQVPGSHFLTQCWNLFYLHAPFLSCPACQENFDHSTYNQPFLRRMQTSFIIKKIVYSQFLKSQNNTRVCELESHPPSMQSQASWLEVATEHFLVPC